MADCYNDFKLLTGVKPAACSYCWQTRSHSTTHWQQPMRSACDPAEAGAGIQRSTSPSYNPAAVALLETDLRALFRDLDGSGRRLKIDMFERRTCSVGGGPTSRVIHCTVYVEGLPETSVEFDRDELKRRTRWRVIEAAICFEPETGILNVMSKGGKDARERISNSHFGWERGLCKGATD
jgi:hypothetical protein